MGETRLIVPETAQLCEDLRPGHRHCIHGHVGDCPDPGECATLCEQCGKPSWSSRICTACEAVQ